MYTTPAQDVRVTKLFNRGVHWYLGHARTCDTRISAPFTPSYMEDTHFTFLPNMGCASDEGDGTGAWGKQSDRLEGHRRVSWIFPADTRGSRDVVVALIAAVVMVDYPSTAKFLTEEECSFITQKENTRSQDEEDHVCEQVWAAFTDGQVWTLSIIELSVIVPVYGITFFLPFGYNTSVSQLLTVPPLPLIALTGYVINISNAPSSVKYFGTFLCVIGSYSAFPGSISWLANNLGGRYKRAVGLAIQIGVGNMGGAIASNIYRTRDEPRYILEHGLEIMFLGIGIVTLPFTVLTQRTNAKRDLAKSLEHDIPSSTHVLVALQ
ncbi:hypothetical protein EV363DRAFT_1494747 [Boletus edulis]|nr:hypothetical protein EV363DRAFT_1494747 [Boletus edulis]